VTIAAPANNQFFASSTFSAQNIAKGEQVSFGVKNGSITPGDYTVNLVHYDYATGEFGEHILNDKSVTALGYGGSMDQITVTIPADLPDDGIHYVKVTYNGATVIAGWGGLLNIL
jgi:hypothetical protein